MHSGSGRKTERDSGKPGGAQPRDVDAQLAADGHRRPPHLRRRPRRRHHQPREKDPPTPATTDVGVIGLYRDLDRRPLQLLLLVSIEAADISSAVISNFDRTFGPI